MADQHDRRAPEATTAATAATLLAPATTDPGREVAEHADTAATAATPASLTADPWDIEFELAQAVIYHRSRLAWLSGVQNSILFFNIFFGTAAASTYIPVAISGLFVALASAFTLATKLPEQLRTQAERLQKCCDMAEKLAENFDSSTALALRKEMVRLSGAEHASFRVVETLAYNEAIAACRRDPQFQREISKSQYRLRHFWRFDGTVFPLKKQSVDIREPSDGPRQ